MTEVSCVVGLGNPGPDYAETRHNVGFWVVEQLAHDLEADGWIAKIPDLPAPQSLGSETMLRLYSSGDRQILLLRPGLFMNRSGGPTRTVADRFGLDATQVLVVYDDLDLPVGRLRLRGRGSSAGHRGVQDIIDQLGTADFPRVRVGIDRPRGEETIVDWVLDPFDPEVRPTVDETVAAAAQACRLWCDRGLEPAMNTFNRWRPAAEEHAENHRISAATEGTDTGRPGSGAETPSRDPSRRADSEPGARRSGTTPQGVTMSTRLYEGMFLFDANESARRWAELEERVESIFAKNDAKIQYAERWPDQRLAFEINGVRKGTHYLTYFTAPPENVQQIRRDSELTEDIMRVLVLHEEGLEDEMARRKELAEKRKNDASARAEAAAEEESSEEAAAEEPTTDTAESTDDAPASEADADGESEADRS